MVAKPNIGSHARPAVNNPKTFTQAYAAPPKKVYVTIPGKVPFIAETCICARGEHKGQQVIIFKAKSPTTGKIVEMARAYPCCWGWRTNCNSTYIDCFTLAI